MSFYSDLSLYFDEIFELSLEETSFIMNAMQGRKRVLDIGCATGAKTALCAGVAECVVGIDPDSAMIQKAQTLNSAPTISYQEAGLLDIGTTFEKESFDGIICLGNTFVHLPDEVAMQKAFTGIAHTLSPSGLFVLQILNYDRILANGISTLPRIETNNTIFDRTYRFANDTLLFDTSLYIKQTQVTLHNSIALFPLQSVTLHTLLQKAGFTSIELFGDFTRKEHDETSIVTIVTCSK